MKLCIGFWGQVAIFPSPVAHFPFAIFPNFHEQPVAYCAIFWVMKLTFQNSQLVSLSLGFEVFVFDLTIDRCV